MTWRSGMRCERRRGGCHRAGGSKASGLTGMSAILPVDFLRLRGEIASAGRNVQPIKLRPVATGERQFRVVLVTDVSRACPTVLPVLTVAVRSDAVRREWIGRIASGKNLSPWEQASCVGVHWPTQQPSNRKMARSSGVDFDQPGASDLLAELPELVVNAFPSPLDLQFR